MLVKCQVGGRQVDLVSENRKGKVIDKFLNGLLRY